MIIKFNDEYLELLYKGGPIKGKPRYSQDIITRFKKVVIILENTESSNELRLLKSLNFEPLKGKKKNKYSVRINDQYRLIFELEKDAFKLEEIVLIDELSKHYE